MNRQFFNVAFTLTGDKKSDEKTMSELLENLMSALKVDVLDSLDEDTLNTKNKQLFFGALSWQFEDVETIRKQKENYRC